jgi:hypothetical protein
MNALPTRARKFSTVLAIATVLGAAALGAKTYFAKNDCCATGAACCKAGGSCCHHGASASLR